MNIVDTLAVDTSWITIIVSLILGITLSASCGFKVFLAPLGIGVAYHTIGFPLGVELSEGFMWIVSWQAILVFSIAAIFEICVGFIPGLGDFMDWVNFTIVPFMGIIATSSFLVIEDPAIKWTLAIIAGGGIATMTGFTDNLISNGVTLLSGGIGRPIVELFNICLSITTILLSLIMPAFSLVFIILFLIFSFFIIKKIRKKRSLKKQLSK